MKEEYKRRHAAIWPEVKAILQKSGVYDYAI
ncbi:MAG: L-rhamnose mutarotase, partial [Sphaerochaeta sp.]|nr:L-rhamnose mutarotase [Sphaerochaeta sp.]